MRNTVYPLNGLFNLVGYVGIRGGLRLMRIKGVFGTDLLHVFQLHSTFFSQTVPAPRTEFEKKGWSCEST